MRRDEKEETMSQQMPPQQQYVQGAQASSLPPQAQARLNNMRHDGNHPGMFTSDLSVNEFLLAREAGFEPLGLVMGTSVYHVGFQFMNWKVSQEVDVLTQAMYHARHLAMSRLVEEADLLGADGIIGVRLEVTIQSWESELAEFVAVGTAVRARNGKSYRNPQGRPFTSDLSGQDFWTLLRAGYLPVGLVMGNSVYHIAHQGLGQWFKQIGRNVELTNYTQGLYEARELAMGRMQGEAQGLRAQGIIGINVTQQNYEWESHVMEFFALGTAVVALSAERTVPAPSLTQRALALA